MRLSEDEPQSLVPQPGNFDIRLVELDGNQQWVVRSLLELHHKFTLTDRHARRGVDEVAEQVPRFRRLVTVADPNGQRAPVVFTRARIYPDPPGTVFYSQYLPNNDCFE